MGNSGRLGKTLSGIRLVLAMFLLLINTSDLVAWQVGRSPLSAWTPESSGAQKARLAGAVWVPTERESAEPWIGVRSIVPNPQQARTVVDTVPPRNAPAVALVTYLKAFVVDDRLSALRRSPDLQSEVIRRIRLGHAVFITRVTRANTAQPSFCRVAVTRRTRGWIHASALAIPGRPGEDQRIMKLIETASDGVDRIALCRMLIDRIGKSPLVPRALLLMGQEAERAAETLSQRARRRLSDVRENDNAAVSDYYLNDASLDRYSKLHIVFGFNQAKTQYVYDGRAYREIIRRFPGREEAKLAGQRLQLMSERMARTQ